VPTPTPTATPEATPEATQAVADGPIALPDGAYSGTGSGFRGDTDVTVTVENGKITKISIDSYRDDNEYFSRAKKTMISRILDAQSVDVDTVSGATYSSSGILDAVADALGLDYTGISSSAHRH